MNTLRKLIDVRIACGGWLLLAALAGCAQATPKELIDARRAYQSAAQGPALERNPAQLHTAQESLKLAEQTFHDEGDSDRTRDRAYVALRKAQIADTQARIDATRDKLAALQQKAEASERAELAEAKSALGSEAQRRQQAEQAAARAAQELSRLAAVKQEERGLVITLSGSVLFASDTSELLPSARQRLDDVAKALLEGNPEAQIVVEGHTDSRGGESYNLDLSARRAEAVRAYLVSRGVPAERVRAQGLGLARPVADNKSAEGRANNRRVEIVVQPGANPT
jgi:outer membrane protein OmpA-like peptidoglycan-associated protein